MELYLGKTSEILPEPQQGFLVLGVSIYPFCANELIRTAGRPKIKMPRVLENRAMKCEWQRLRSSNICFLIYIKIRIFGLPIGEPDESDSIIKSMAKHHGNEIIAADHI